MNRKIELPNCCCREDVSIHGGKDDCEHDYSPEYEDKESYLQWKCTKCGCEVRVGIKE